jgi:DNA-binding MarR family transcriptional regulator
MSRLLGEIQQTRPFESPQQEALLNLIRTSDQLQRRLQLALRPWGITLTQYNVLRILRGAGDGSGLPCSEIGARMVTAEPDITRLLNRLAARRLIERRRDREDRRVVRTAITGRGLELLGELQPVVDQYRHGLFEGMSAREVAALTALLEKARGRCRAGETPDPSGPPA